MAFRRPMKKQRSRKSFTKYAQRTHKKNFGSVLRGGHRL